MPPLAATGATPGSIKLKLGYDHNSVVQLGNQQTIAQVILFRHNLGEGELISWLQSKRKEPRGRTMFPLSLILPRKVSRLRYLEIKFVNDGFKQFGLYGIRFEFVCALPAVIMLFEVCGKVSRNKYLNSSADKGTVSMYIVM